MNATYPFTLKWKPLKEQFITNPQNHRLFVYKISLKSTQNVAAQSFKGLNNTTDKLKRTYDKLKIHDVKTEVTLI